MLLITEVNDNVNLVTEEVNGEKQYHIDGIFMQAEQKNRNGRVYPKKTLMNEVLEGRHELHAAAPAPLATAVPVGDRCARAAARA